jgi:hypothetical protein
MREVKVLEARISEIIKIEDERKNLIPHQIGEESALQSNINSRDAVDPLE